jgi:uncharacterized membrane protein
MDFIDVIVLWIHIFAAVVFIGPQVFLVVVTIPALRSVADAQVRRELTRKVTMGFGMVGGAALAVLVLTGLWNYQEADDQGLLDFKRYFIALQIKLTLVTIVVILTVLHGAFLGRRLQRLQETNANEAELAQARMWSMAASMATLVASIAILLCAAVLASLWSKAGGLR